LEIGFLPTLSPFPNFKIREYPIRADFKMAFNVLGRNLFYAIHLGGAISFGLINIPVRLYTAVKETRPDLDMLHKQDRSPIRYARVCKADGEEIPFSDIVKGYEYQKGDYIILEDEDFRRANVRKTQTIDILDFVDQAEINPMFLEKPYYLEPTKESRKAYVLLCQGLKKTGKIGIGKFVLRTREHLISLKPQGDMLILEQMRFADQIVNSEPLNIPHEEKVSPRELDLAIKLIEQLTTTFHPEEYKDTYSDELMKIIEDKAHGIKPQPRGEEPVPTEVPDLMAKLRESLAEAKKKRVAGSESRVSS
jgi:DNA end-binding protein Ku